MNASCESCEHLRPRQATDIVRSAGYFHATHWCKALEMPTYPHAFRCGGDDYKAKILDSSATVDSVSQAVTQGRALFQSAAERKDSQGNRKLRVL